MARCFIIAVLLASVTANLARAELSGPMREEFIASSNRSCFESVQKQGRLAAEENIRIVKSTCRCMSIHSAEVATADDVIDAAAHRAPNAAFMARIKGFLNACFDEAVHESK